jgi:hypothetical protein
LTCAVEDLPDDPSRGLGKQQARDGDEQCDRERHEMAHIDGADEAGAQRREEGLWKRFVMDGRVDRVTALRYLKLMNDRRSGS